VVKSLEVKLGMQIERVVRIRIAERRRGIMNTFCPVQRASPSLSSFPIVHEDGGRVQDLQVRSPGRPFPCPMIDRNVDLLEGQRLSTRGAWG
jgi:hypothetical protein